MNLEITYIGGLASGVIGDRQPVPFKRGVPVTVSEDVARNLLSANPDDWDGPEILKTQPSTKD